MNTNSTAILYTLSVAAGVAMVGLGIIWPLMPVMATQMGAGGFALGVIIASFNVSRTLFSPFVGRVSDRFGRKNFILVGLALYAIISLGYLWADSTVTLTFVRMAHGFASLLVVPIAMALAGDIAPRDQIGSYMGTVNMAVMIGLGFGPSVGGALFQYFGMDSAFYCMGAFALVVGAFVTWFIPHDSKSGAVVRKEGTATLREILSNQTAFALILMRFFVAAGQGAVYTFLPIYTMQIELSGAQLGVILSANIFLIALMQRPVGRMSDHVNPKYAVIIGMFASTLAVLGMPFFEGFWSILLLNIFMGLATGFILPGSLVISGYLGKTMGMASLMSVTDAAWSLGMIVSPVLSGLIMDTWGITHVFTAGAGLIGVGSLVVTFLMAGYEPDRGG